MLSRVIKINEEGQSLIYELQDGIAVAPTFFEFDKREQYGQYFILRNIQDQGITAFWTGPSDALPKVFEKVFSEDVSQQIIQEYEMRSLRKPREIKPHEENINPAFVNLGKIHQDVSDVKPIKLDTHIRYLWLHNAAGEMILGVEHIWDYVALCDFNEYASKIVEEIKIAIVENHIMRYLEADEKPKLTKEELAEKEKEMSILANHEVKRAVGNRKLHDEPAVLSVKKDKPKKPASIEASAKINKMLKVKGGLGHASLSPVYEDNGTLASLRGAAYMAGELAYIRDQWILSNKSGRFFSENDSEESNKRILSANADFLNRRSGEDIHIVLEKSKLDPQFLWHKALNVKQDEFKGDKVKIAFNCISKVYKFNSEYDYDKKLKKKMKLNKKEKIFNQLYPATNPEMTSEERFAAAIVYILDGILPYERTVRAGLVKQIQCMIEHQLSDAIPQVKKAALLDSLHAREQEFWEVVNGAIVVSELTQDGPKLGR